MRSPQNGDIFDVTIYDEQTRHENVYNRTYQSKANTR
jgi:hypothetical protein